jgi:hypothetical protein
LENILRSFKIVASNEDIENFPSKGSISSSQVVVSAEQGMLPANHQQ